MTKQIIIKNESDVSDWINQVSANLAEYSDNANSRFFRSALIAIAESTNLMECMKTPAGQASVYNSLKYAAATGLSLNPQEGKACLIAYKGQSGPVVNYQIMKNGIIEMAMRSGKIEWLRADIVRENDDYEPPANPDDKVIYKPARKNRGDVDGYFAEVKLTDGSVHFKYMTVDEVEAHRDEYSQNYKSNKNNSPWTKSFNGMALKTVLKALFRNTYISPEMNEAIGIDDKEESEIINITPGFSPDDVNEKLTEEKEKSLAKKEAEKKVEPGAKKKGDLGF